MLNMEQIEHLKIKHRPIKRLFDLFFSSLAILCLTPIFLLLTLIVRISSKGKVFYSHPRVGRGGRMFKCYKFRTMYPDADERLNEILNSDPEKKNEWQASRKLKQDPRITPIGRILRKTSLDELPQFFNVLKGDLSVVGPRPVVHEEVREHYGMKAAKILSIRPGITGIWQVSGRSDTSYTYRVQLDEKFVDSHSIALDLKLIMKTIPSMISSKGAY